jgi:hypothetical protein
MPVERRRERSTPMLRIVPDEAGCDDLALTLDEICLEGARKMVAAALMAEADAYVGGGSW